VFDLVAAGLTITAAALTVGCSRQTPSKWVNRRRRGESLQDRSSRPRHSPRRTPEAVEQAILRARAELREGPGDRLGTGSGLDRACSAAPARSLAACRAHAARGGGALERSAPGELVHVDIKKLGRIIRPGHRVTGDRSSKAKDKAGWQHVYVAIDDHSRLGFASVHPDETADSALVFLDQLVRF
jgi:transposase-like protein